MFGKTISLWRESSPLIRLISWSHNSIEAIWQNDSAFWGPPSHHGKNRKKSQFLWFCHSLNFRALFSMITLCWILKDLFVLGKINVGCSSLAHRIFFCFFCQAQITIMLLMWRGWKNFTLQCKIILFTSQLLNKKKRVL